MVDGRIETFAIEKETLTKYVLIKVHKVFSETFKPRLTFWECGFKIAYIGAYYFYKYITGYGTFERNNSHFDQFGLVLTCPNF